MKARPRQTRMRRAADALFHAAPRVIRGPITSVVLDGVNGADRRRSGMQSMESAVRHLAGLGLAPATIFDVGAHVGTWTTNAADVFPDARLVMVEPVADHVARLGAVAAELGDRATVEQVLLGSEARAAVPFNVMGTGSSLFDENTPFPRERVELPMGTLDGLAGDYAGPLLLKLDVQGAELEVLRGGRETLARSDALVLEVSLIEYNRGAPLFAEVVEFLRQRDFVLFDLCGGLRREADGALFQMDCVFVPEISGLRSSKEFWSHELDAS